MPLKKIYRSRKELGPKTLRSENNKKKKKISTAVTKCGIPFESNTEQIPYYEAGRDETHNSMHKASSYRHLDRYYSIV